MNLAKETGNLVLLLTNSDLGIWICFVICLTTSLHWEIEILAVCGTLTKYHQKFRYLAEKTPFLKSLALTHTVTLFVNTFKIR